MTSPPPLSNVPFTQPISHVLDNPSQCGRHKVWSLVCLRHGAIDRGPLVVLGEGEVRPAGEVEDLHLRGLDARLQLGVVAGAPLSPREEVLGTIIHK